MSPALSLLLLALFTLGFMISVRMVRRRQQRETIFPLGPTVRVRPRPRQARTRAQAVQRPPVQPQAAPTPTARQTARNHVPVTAVVDHLPVQKRQRFLSRHEHAFLASLEVALGPDFRVFRNVPLEDIVLVATRSPRQELATAARLRGRQVDYLVVSLPELTPVLAIDLGDDTSGSSLWAADPVKAAACASAGLPLVQLGMESAWTPDSLRAYLKLNAGQPRRNPAEPHVGGMEF